MVAPVIAAIVQYIGLVCMGLLTVVSVGNALSSCLPWCGRRVEDATYIGYGHEDLLKSNAPDVMVAVLMKVEPFYEALPPHTQQTDYTKFQVNHSHGVAVFHVPKRGKYARYELFGIETVFAPGTDIILGIRMVWETNNTVEVARYMREIEVKIDPRKRNLSKLPPSPLATLEYLEHLEYTPDHN